MRNFLKKLRVIKAMQATSQCCGRSRSVVVRDKTDEGIGERWTRLVCAKGSLDSATNWIRGKSRCSWASGAPLLQCCSQQHELVAGEGAQSPGLLVATWPLGPPARGPFFPHWVAVTLLCSSSPHFISYFSHWLSSTLG